ncbi:MAG: MBOAT family protein [Planctomycetes bacterium]|nr:MBOAT family protein [Planctomycetota bacterium]
MVFSSPVFLFVFLPAVLAAYFLFGRRLHNFVLMTASLLFYAWGEPALVLVMLLSITVNFAFGLWVERLAVTSSTTGEKRRSAIAVAVIFNIALLATFKYADWLWSVASSLLIASGAIDAPLGLLSDALHLSPGLRAALCTEAGTIRLPIGVSFFTFQAMSYVIDIHRLEVRAQRSIVNFALYKSLFPQLIAGPIVRYADVAEQLVSRVTTAQGFAYGVRRFALGLGKKLLIANTAALPADLIFALPGDELTAAVAWFGVVCYAIQLYFDFSGYSDMAIGLGHMFGFRFLENFNYPYISTTITEYWRRWHISLSTWLRDYLYFPLGGNRHGKARTYFNLFTVFFLCGLWHGAAWNFVLFGMFHGAIMVVERLGLGRIVRSLHPVLQRVYFLPLMLVTYAVFRGEGLRATGAYLTAMFGLNADPGPNQHVSLYLDAAVGAALVAGIIGSMPWLPKVLEWRRSLELANERVGLRRALDFAGVVLVMGVLSFAAMVLSADTYNPFIYFRF